LVEPTPGDVAETARLFARRGYVMSVPDLARWCTGGPVPSAEVERAIRESRDLSLIDGWVVPSGAEGLIADSIARQAEHGECAARWASASREYAKRLVRHCPWVRCVLVSGSMASGGFREDDDIDISLVTQDDTKHVTYITAVLLSLPFAWRHRRRASRE